MNLMAGGATGAERSTSTTSAAGFKTTRRGGMGVGDLLLSSGASSGPGLTTSTGLAADCTGRPPPEDTESLAALRSARLAAMRALNCFAFLCRDESVGWLPALAELVVAAGAAGAAPGRAGGGRGGRRSPLPGPTGAGARGEEGQRLARRRSMLICSRESSRSFREAACSWLELANPWPIDSTNSRP